MPPVLVLGCLVAVPGQAVADDPLPTLSVNDVSAEEGSTVPVVITLSAVAEADVTVTAATSGGSGYTNRNETVTILAGQTTAAFGIETQENDLDQPDRTFTVTLSAPSANAELGDATGTEMITDDDATPTLAITGPATIGEAGTAAYSVAITGKSAAEVTVNWAVVNGTATDADYVPPRSGTLNWPSEFTGTRSISIPMFNDALDEFDETFAVTLSSPSGATINPPGTASTSITDNDDEPSVASISNVTVVEGNSGTVDAAVTVTLSAASGKTVTVPYATAPATASEGSDYEHKAGNFVFVPGEDLTETVVFKVRGDTLFEPEEKFSVVLTDPTNGAPGPDMRGEVTITDDDSTPIPTMTNPSVAEGNSGLTDLVFERRSQLPIQR